MGNNCSSCRQCQKNQEVIVEISHQIPSDDVNQRQQYSSSRSSNSLISKKNMLREIKQHYIVKEPPIELKPSKSKELQAIKIQKAWRKYRKIKKEEQSQKEKKNLQKYVDEDKQIVYQADQNLKREKRTIFKFSNGSTYEGEWKGRMRDGFGTQIWVDGAKYEGQWENNKACGKGTFYHANGDTFTEINSLQVLGKMIERMGSEFIFKQMVPFMKVIGLMICNMEWAKNYGLINLGMKVSMLWELNKAMVIQYKRNLLSGKYKWCDGSIYEGQWLENKINGYGEYIWTDGRKYRGNWLANNMNGEGEYIWTDGRKYIGSYINDKKDGYGKYTWSDGRSYEGYWKNGKQHGKGKFKLLDGTIKQGIWEEGKRIKWELEN